MKDRWLMWLVFAVAWILVLVFALLVLAMLGMYLAGPAHADDGGIDIGGGGSSSGRGFNPDVNVSAGASLLFMCPGRGSAANVVGAGGGYCDWGFSAQGHYHCEWGGWAPLLEMWNCWRVWPGRSDHDPANLNDPDIIPDGWMTPWALNGPTPQNQWPPPGLMPVPAEGEPLPPQEPLPDLGLPVSPDEQHEAIPVPRGHVKVPLPMPGG